MKKLLLFATALMISVVLVQGKSTIPIKGVDVVADTLEHRQIGPGVTYTRVTLPSYPLNFYTLTIDMDNAYGKIETFQAQDIAGKTEAMTTASKRLSTNEKQVLGGVNANFWIVSGQGQPTELLGVSHSGSARNGEMITDPNSWNRGHGDIGFAVVDADKKVWIDDMEFDGGVTIDGVGAYPISEINRIRKTNELVFFNSYVGATTRSDDNGTEVFIKPVSAQSWSVNQDVLCEVTRVVKDKGANQILAGESVLSGTGNAKVFLENLQPGQTVKVKMGVYTIADQLRPIVTQMVTGNALVLKNGQLTERNYNEAYNTTLYPRTGISTSADGKKVTLIVIDKAGKSVGANTETMCEILKAAGMSDATSMDGGGSAQMMLGGEIVNKPADGKERPVANGWFVYSLAPQDDEITEIRFKDYNLYTPALASYKPVVLAYNKYGDLINENLEGVTLTCDPSLGSISADGTTFIATGAAAVGQLMANYNGVATTKTMTVEQNDILMRLDSVLIDGNRRYPIEVLSQVGETTYTYDPASINWTIDDTNICAVENGLLQGLNNGSTTIVGTLGQSSVSMKVKVEIPTQRKQPVDDFEGWELAAISSITEKTLEKTADGANYNFHYKTGRLPYARMNKTVLLYAIPDSLVLTLNSDIPLSDAKLYLSVNNVLDFSIYSLGALEVEKDIEKRIAFKDLFDTNDIATFPIKLSSLYFNIASSAVSDKSYSIKIKDLSLIYDYVTDGSGIESDEVFNTELGVYPNPAVGNKIELNLEAFDNSSVDVRLYNIAGKLVQQQSFVAEENASLLLNKNIVSGVYIISATSNNLRKTTRLIVR